jgi:gliding motility-associated-like protein
VSGAIGGSGSNINQTLTVIGGTTTTVEVVYTIIPEANGCAGAPQVLRVRVNPIPVVTVASSVAPICSGGTTNISFTGTIPGTIYNWVVTNVSGVVGASNGTGTSIQQVLTSTGLSQGVVKYEITPTLNGCAGTTQSVTVLVNPRPELFANPTHPPICSGVLPTNIFLSSFNTLTVFSWTVNAVGVNGASVGSAIGPTYTIIQNLTTSVNNVAGYVDYVITPTLAGCSGTPFTVRVVVNPLPRPVLNDGAICVDELGNTFQTYVLNSGLDNATYDFVWYFNGVAIPNSNTATYTANAVGTYGVIATNRVTNCASPIVNANITATTPVSSFTVIQSDYFSDNPTIIVNAIGGSGNLIYSLDEGLFQFSNVFSGVSAGTHTVTVEDTDGCTNLTQEVVIIDYPRFFTPNGDGYNDTWNVVGLSQFASAVKIYIFDRYGKLLKQIGVAGLGWDGTYNGYQLPADDYWFTIDYPEQNEMKQFRAHFSLKR